MESCLKLSLVDYKGVTVKLLKLTGEAGLATACTQPQQPIAAAASRRVCLQRQAGAAVRVLLLRPPLHASLGLVSSLLVSRGIWVLITPTTQVNSAVCARTSCVSAVCCRCPACGSPGGWRAHTHTYGRAGPHTTGVLQYCLTVECWHGFRSTWPTTPGVIVITVGAACTRRQCCFCRKQNVA